MLPDVAILKRRSKKKVKQQPPYSHTHTHTKWEITTLLDSGQIGDGFGWCCSFTGTRKNSPPIVHDPVRSSTFIRPRAHSSERMQCYLSLLLSNKLRLILRTKKKKARPSGTFCDVILLSAIPRPQHHHPRTAVVCGVVWIENF